MNESHLNLSYRIDKIVQLFSKKEFSIIKKVNKKVIAHNPHALSIEEKVVLLKEFTLFRDVPLDMLAEYAQKMFHQVIHPKEIFIEEGLDEEYTYFIHKGVASVFRTTEDGRIINIDLLGAPDIVGEMGLTDTTPNTSSVMAVDEVHALVLPQLEFNQLLTTNTQVLVRFLRHFDDRIRQFDEYFEELLSRDLHDRTWNTIQYLARFFENGVITLSHEELADLIWGTRSRVTEVLNQLEKEKKIKATHRKIKILGK